MKGAELGPLVAGATERNESGEAMALEGVNVVVRVVYDLRLVLTDPAGWSFGEYALFDALPEVTLEVGSVGVEPHA